MPIIRDAHVTRHDDYAQTDPFLVCDVCGENLCTIEEGDSFSVLASVISDHEPECKS
jgi:hypothetical protein